MDWTAQPNRVQQLAGLLADARTHEPDDLPTDKELMEEVRHVLAVPPSDHPLERELHGLLNRTVQAPDTVEPYDADRAIAEAQGMVGPGGAIVYQYRWQEADGDWSDWRTWRTRFREEKVVYPKDIAIVQVRVAPASDYH